jgi:hypothetical protein
MPAAVFRSPTCPSSWLIEVTSSTYWQVVPYKPPGCARPHEPLVICADRLTQTSAFWILSRNNPYRQSAEISYRHHEATYVKHVTSADITTDCDDQRPALIFLTSRCAQSDRWAWLSARRSLLSRTSTFQLQKSVITAAGILRHTGEGRTYHAFLPQHD